MYLISIVDDNANLLTSLELRFKSRGYGVKSFIDPSDALTYHQKNPADFYLIDSSGSMANGDWQRIIRGISYHRPPRSRVFLSTTKCISRGSNVNLINPSGATEIWMSYWKIIDYMSPGQSLIIVSDFDSSYPLQPWERSIISNKISEKNIIVRTVRP